MLLPDHAILDHIYGGQIGCDPFTAEALQPASLDVRLAWSYPDPVTGEPRPAPSGSTFTMKPGAFRLAHTIETIRLPADIAAQLSTKSSLARLGLSSHQTAGWVDPGFEGQLVLELHNASDTSIKLHHGQFVAQLTFMRLESAAHRPYGHPNLGSHYQHQKGAVPSHLETAP